MVIPSIRGHDLQTKKEGETTGNKVSQGPSTSRQWPSVYRNPRIVRVSRNFGGKDRHSKVSTVRGLRDRRIRLSVPTAVQLYDLQEKLGLTQPSKVIDWLLDITKNDIDTLPPLQIPPGGFVQSHQFLVPASDQKLTVPQLAPFLDTSIPFMKDHGRTHSMYSSKEGLNFSNSSFVGGDEIDLFKSRRSDPDAPWGTKGDEIKGKTIVNNFQHQGGTNSNPQVYSAQNLFPLVTSHGGLASLQNNPVSYTPLFNWEPSNMSSSHVGTSFFPSQADHQDPHHHHHKNGMFFQSSLPLASGSQVLIYPQFTPSNASAAHSDSYISQFQPMNSSTSQNAGLNSLAPFPPSLSSSLKSFSLNVNSRIVHGPTVNDESQLRRGN